jgi:hypothetical protein
MGGPIAHDSLQMIDHMLPSAPSGTINVSLHQVTCSYEVYTVHRAVTVRDLLGQVESLRLNTVKV